MSQSAEDLLDGIRTLLRAFTVDESRFPPAEGRVKYNAADFQALHFLSQNVGGTSSQLARFLGVAPTTAMSVCERLIKRGFVKRERHSSDQRAVSLTLTSKGKSIVEAIRRQDLSNCELMLSKLPARDRARFASQLLAIATALAVSDQK
jgi:DNA-binding MarR family transcriptional regulator